MYNTQRLWRCYVRKIKKVLLLIMALSCVQFTTTIVMAQKEKKTTIRILHFWGDTDTDPSCKYLNILLAEEFEKEFPDVDLVQITCDKETYKQKIKVLMAADELPDIMFDYGGGFSEAFVNAGRLLNLDSYLSDFYKAHVNEQYQNNFIYDGKQYGIGFTQWTGVLYCNQELFNKYNLEIPETFNQLKSVCSEFRNEGIDPIACGMADKWAGAQLINNFMFQLCGLELYNDMSEVRQSMNNDKVVQAAQAVADLLGQGAFSENMMSMNSGDGEEEFLAGEAAMIYNGSWFARTVSDRLGDKVVAVKMPKLFGAVETNDYHGGCSAGWVVSSATQEPELSVKIAEWLSYNIGTFQPENSTFNIEKKDIRQKENTLSQQIQKLYKNKSDGAMNWDVLLTPERANIWLDTCTELLAGYTNGIGFSWTMDVHLY